MLSLAHRALSIKPSPTLAVAARAEALKREGRPVISLSTGEPDFDTPEHIKQAAIDALARGQTKYTPVDGTAELKQAIVTKFKRENNLTYDAKQILVSCGAKQSCYNLLQAVINPEDEVVIPAPYWVSYPDMALLAGGKPVVVDPSPGQLKITPAQLAAAMTAKTKLVFLNSPSNPSGLCYSQDELHGFAEVLQKYPEVIIASDDIYEHVRFHQDAFYNIVNVCPALYDRTVVINGVSKAYAMTGWRIGYAAGPVAIITAMKNIQSQSTSNPTSIAQAATVVALNGDQSFIPTMARAFKARHDFVVKALNAIPGVQCTPADGTFYAFPNMQGVLARKPELRDDIALAEYLLDKAEVAVVPGSAFGMAGYLRLSYATSEANLQEAMKRIQRCLA